MSMIKRATSREKVVVSSLVYICDKCGYTEMGTSSRKKSKKCPECGEKMNAVVSNDIEDKE